MSASDSTASLRFERTLSRFQTVVRGASIAQVVADLALVSPSLRRPRLAWAAVAGVVSHGAWGSYRMLAGRRDPLLARSEVPVAIALLAAERLAAGPMTPRTGPRSASDYMGSAALLHSTEASDLAQAVPGIALLVAATFLNRTEERGRVGARLVDVLLVADTLVATALVRGLRAQAAAADAADQLARHEASRVAEEEEWRRQHRLVHDSVLQTLELIAGDWHVDEHVLTRRIDLDLERLSQLLRRSDDPVSTDIAEALSDLVTEFRARGITVDFEETIGATVTAAPTADALISATREALTNVEKHSGVRRAELTATGDRAGLRIDVVDAGVGFDPTRTPFGFGLAESITGSLADLGGWATVTAAPGRGVRISMGVPQ